MSYARWATKDEILNSSTKITWGDISKSGIQLMYDDDSMYIDGSEIHNLIIGATGSGKTQTTVLPQIYLSIMSGESTIVNDPRGEIYALTAGLAKEQGFKINVIDFMDPSKGNNFNPLYLPYKLYKEGNIDAAIEMLEDVGYYIVCDSHKTDADPFWETSATNLFTGLALYLFEKARNADEVNLNSIVNMGNNIEEVSKEIQSMDKNSLIYTTLAAIINAPGETKGSIISVFQQKAGLITSRETISKLICNNNIDLENVKDKTITYIIANGRCSDLIVPMLLNEVCKISDINKDKKKLNIILDEFNTYKPIRNFNNILTVSRSINIRFNIYIQSILELEYVYGKKEAGFIRMCFANIIYLLANDAETLEFISSSCGRASESQMLVTKEDLKILRPFEAIILKNRMYPIKTKLLPYFELKIETIAPPEIPNLEYTNVVIFK